MNRRTIRTTVATIACCALGIGSAAAGPLYHFTDLGMLLGPNTAAFDINNEGHVVGSSGSDAFVYDGAVTHTLGTLGGTNSIAYGINIGGQVVGGSDLAGDATFHAFLYSGGTMNDLKTPAGFASSVALDVNDSGEVVGWGFNTQGSIEGAFYYSGGSMHDLGFAAGTTSNAYGVNNSGQIVGVVDDHAFLYSGGSVIDFSAIGAGYFSLARGINDSGQVVGYAVFNHGPNQTAFLFSNGLFTDLGTLGGPLSEADAINSSGVIVGEANTASGDGHAFVYSNGTMIDLNTLISPIPNWSLFEAVGINDAGDIIGYGFEGNITHAFLLTPVPEPSTLALLGLGAVGLLAVARRARIRPRA